MAVDRQPPKAVVEQVLRYKRSGETHNVYETRTEYEGELYYYNAYWRRGEIIGHLIAREDGYVPSMSEAEPILRIAIGVNGKLHQFITIGPQWITVEQVWVEMKKRLQRLYQGTKQEMTPEIQAAYQDFLRVPEVALEENKRITEAYEKAMEIRDELEEREDIADQAIDDRLGSLLDQLVIGKNNQHLSLLNTEESREKVLRFWSKQIPIWKLGQRFALRVLRNHHKRLLFSKEERGYVMAMQDDVTRRKVSEEEFPEILEETRNPR